MGTACRLQPNVLVYCAAENRRVEEKDAQRGEYDSVKLTADNLDIIKQTSRTYFILIGK